MISERIKQIIDNEKLSVREFERRISCGQGVIAKCVKHNTDISSSVMAQIVKTFPQYSPIWILTGEGEMIVSENVSKNVSKKDEIGGINQVAIEKKLEKLLSGVDELKKDIAKMNNNRNNDDERC